MKKLFDKLQDKIKQNIELTDPKNFIDHKRVPTFVDTMNEQKKIKGEKEYKIVSGLRQCQGISNNTY